MLPISAAEWRLASSHSVLVRTSALRPSQSAQLSAAIIFFRFRNRNACAARWPHSPAAHTGQPCDNTMRPATSADTASVNPRQHDHLIARYLIPEPRTTITDLLRAHARLIFGRTPPPDLSKDLLRRMIAWRLQERAFGDRHRVSNFIQTYFGRTACLASRSERRSWPVPPRWQSAP
jgi:hypothetical protein